MRFLSYSLKTKDYKKIEEYGERWQEKTRAKQLKYEAEEMLFFSRR